MKRNGFEGQVLTSLTYIQKQVDEHKQQLEKTNDKIEKIHSRLGAGSRKIEKANVTSKLALWLSGIAITGLITIAIAILKVIK